jgi:choline dehydrogenase
MSTALSYLNQARDRQNLTIRANVTARRIVFEGRRAVGVECESGGETFTVEGEQIVLSAGGIASPQLLMLSGVGPAEHLGSLGIEVVHDLPGVGQNLRDHPMGVILFRETGAMPGDLETMAQVVLRYTVEGSSTRNDMQIFHLPLDTTYRQYLPPHVPLTSTDNCFALCVGLQNAVSSGELKLTSKDPHVQPSINHRYLSDSWDRERMRKAVRLVIRLSQHPAFKDVILERIAPTEADVISDEALDAWLLRNIDTLYHTSGTCKMGPASDTLAVVDQYCHVRGLAGLRVVDTSVMPDVIRANTNATVIMIAERVADWIKGSR